MLKLFYAPGSCALASHIALEEAGAAYETVKMDLKARDQYAPGYLAINPKGRVPALLTGHGVLTETPAVLTYIARIFPAARLAPEDAFAYAELQSFNAYLCSTVHVAHAHRGRGTRWADDPAAIAEMTRKAPEAVAAAFKLVEDGMLRGPWVMGEAYTIADPYLFTLARWLEGDSVDLATLPRVVEHRLRMLERPAVRKVIASHV